MIGMMKNNPGPSRERKRPSRKTTALSSVLYIQKGKVKVTVVSEQGKEEVMAGLVLLSMIQGAKKLSAAVAVSSVARSVILKTSCSLGGGLEPAGMVTSMRNSST